MKKLLNLIKCKKCGLCCYIQLSFRVDNKQFVPVPFTIDEGEDNEKKYLSLQVCESFDRETRKCKDYENRPNNCKKFNCHGDSKPQTLEITGKPTWRIK